jgi:hypothetical protein
MPSLEFGEQAGDAGGAGLRALQLLDQLQVVAQPPLAAVRATAGARRPAAHTPASAAIAPRRLACAASAATASCQCRCANRVGVEGGDLRGGQAEQRRGEQRAQAAVVGGREQCGEEGAHVAHLLALVQAGAPADTLGMPAADSCRCISSASSLRATSTLMSPGRTGRAT